MNQTFFRRHGLLILMLVCFWVPFGLRGARFAARGMKNEVKDWLPSSFRETAELEEFRKHFLGEAFVMVSWDGCTGTVDDLRFRKFVDGLFAEIPPSQRDRRAVSDPNEHVDENLGLYARQLRATPDWQLQDTVGNRLGLYVSDDDHFNWAGLNEKWMQGDDRKWYYIVPSGDIYRWDEINTPLGNMVRVAKRVVTGKQEVSSTLVAQFPGSDGPWYYAKPARLEAQLVKSFATGPSLLSDLTKEGGALEGDVAAAKERLKGVLFGPDEETTCIIATLTDRGRDDLHKIVGRGVMARPRGIVMRVADASDIDAPDRPSLLPPFFQPFVGDGEVITGSPILRLGGPPVDNVAIDEEGQVTLARLVGFSVLLGITISWLSFRNWGVVMMLFFVGASSAVASLSFVWYGRSVMDAILMSMPSLVYVLGLSGAVHIVNYYRDTVDQLGYPGSPTQAVLHGWKPCTIAALTTALGLVSLATSNIIPIRKFGFFSALGVLFTLTLMFAFLPAALSYWPPKNFGSKKDPDGDSNTDSNGDAEKLTLADRVHNFWAGVGELCIRRHRLVAIVCTIIFLLTLFGLPKVKTSIHLLKLFGEENKIIQDYGWLEQNIGKLVPMEMLVRIDPSQMRSAELAEANGLPSDERPAAADQKFRMNFLERMEITERIRKTVETKFGGANDVTGRAMLAASFVPPLPEPSSRKATRGAFSKRLASYRDDIKESDYFRTDEDGSELWRVSLRLGALNDLDYGAFVGDLQQTVEPMLSAYRTRDQMLRGIDAAKNGAGWRGAKVLLLGVPFGASSFAKTPVPNVAAEFTPEEIAEKEPIAIYASTLQSLMRGNAISPKYWHDQRFALPTDFAKQLADFDCVVVVQEDPRYDLAMLKNHVVNVIDARQASRGFDENGLTAHQRHLPVSISYTGLVPIVYKAQRTLLRSLVRSTGWAFVAITIVMIVLLRSGSAGMVSMLPNVFPVVVVFGLMGWLGILVDIGTMMTASVAMGVAVDDTVHFLTWFRRGLDQGNSRNDAIRLAYDRCATAMTQTTLIGGLGLSVFAFSTFTPTSRFGTLMLTLMVAALVGDLVFLPALLAGRAGKVFEPEVGRRRIDSGNAEAATIAPRPKGRAIFNQAHIDERVLPRRRKPGTASSELRE